MDTSVVRLSLKSGGVKSSMKNFSRRAASGFLITLMSLNSYMAVAQKYNSNPQLMKDIQTLDKISQGFNAKDESKKQKISDVLISFEKLMGRKLTFTEKSFLTLQFIALPSLPRFESNGNSIQVYDMHEGSKDLLVSIEVVDAEKNIFKFGNRTFTVDPEKPLHENVRFILNELDKGSKTSTSFLDKLNPFHINQAHAMADWVKYVLIGAVALVVGFIIGKQIQKNKDKKDSAVAEGGGGSSRGIVAESTEEEAADSHTLTSSEAETASSDPALVQSDTSTDQNTESTTTDEALPASGEEPSVV